MRTKRAWSPLGATRSTVRLAASSPPKALRLTVIAAALKTVSATIDRGCFTGFDQQVAPWVDEVQIHKNRIDMVALVDGVLTGIEIKSGTDTLEALGPLLTFPHASGIAGTHDVAVRELRPRRGRSRWRPLYCRVGDVFLILAIAREAGVDRREFAASVDRAERRRLDLPEFDR